MKKYTGWQDIATRQSRQIINELVDAKEQQKALLLISDTGLGKTNSIEIFMRKMGDATYCITVGASYKLHHVVNAIMEQLNIVNHRLKPLETYEKLKLIAAKLKEIQKEGRLPMIILDEAENLLPSILKMLKELYDAIYKYCSIVLIGTDQILDSMLNRRNKNRQSVPQLWSRFEAGCRYISPLEKGKDFKAFFDLYIPDEAGIQALLIEKCNNYRVLYNYLHPVLVKADKTGKPVTEELFRLVNKIHPKLKIA